MSIRARVHPKSKRVMLDIPKHLRKHRTSIEQALYEIGKIVGNETDRLITTGTRTGRIYRFRGLRHQASAFGEPPATRSGRLARSYDYRVHGWHKMTVGEEADYAGFLERGTRFIKPRQHLILAINNKAGDTVKIFQTYTKRNILKK